MNPQPLTEHLTEVKDYITSINQTSLDINALYIIQAYLTKLQASLKPNTILNTLFLKQDLETMFQLTSEQGNADSQLQYSQRIICEQLLKYFKTYSLAEAHGQHNLQEVGQLIQRILESLEEWSVIGRRVKKMQGKLQRYRMCVKESEGLRKLQENLEEFLDKLLTGNNRTEFTTVQSQNQSFSIESRETVVTPEGQMEVTCQFLTKSQVIQFLGYLSMWMNQLNQEICEYKSVLEQTKSESSIDERQFKLQPKKKRVAKTSLLTSKIKQGHLDIPKIDHNFFDQKENHSTLPKRRSAWLAPLSQMNCTMKAERTLSHRVLLANFSPTQLPNKQKLPKSKVQSCSQCQIY